MLIKSRFSLAVSSILCKISEKTIMSSGTETILSEVQAHEEIKEFLWEIPNFFQIQRCPAKVNRQTIEIDVGKLAHLRSKWQIGLRVTENESAFNATFKLLKVAEAGTSAFAKINIELLKLDGSSQAPQTYQLYFDENQELVTALPFLAISYKKEHGYATYLNKHGALNLKIKLSVVHKDVKSSSVVTCLKNDSLAKLHQALSNLMSQAFNSDVKIICNDGKEFNVHKSILSANSDVFEAMFSSQSDFAENRTGVIQVDDLSGKTMDVLLTHMYTLELKPTWSDPGIIAEFIYAAGKYQLKELLATLDDRLGLDNVSVCNMTLLNLAHKLQLKKAESQLRARIAQLTSAAKTSEDLFAIFGTGEEPAKMKALPSA